MDHGLGRAGIAEFGGSGPVLQVARFGEELRGLAALPVGMAADEVQEPGVGDRLALELEGRDFQHAIGVFVAQHRSEFAARQPGPVLPGGDAGQGEQGQEQDAGRFHAQCAAPSPRSVPARTLATSSLLTWPPGLPQLLSA